jgi:hypothetical protein
VQRLLALLCTVTLGILCSSVASANEWSARNVKPTRYQEGVETLNRYLTEHKYPKSVIDRALAHTDLQLLPQKHATFIDPKAESSYSVGLSSTGVVLSSEGVREKSNKRSLLGANVYFDAVTGKLEVRRTATKNGETRIEVFRVRPNKDKLGSFIEEKRRYIKSIGDDGREQLIPEPNDRKHAVESFIGIKDRADGLRLLGL